MGNEAGCGAIGLIFVIAAAWAAFFYSNASLLYLRHEFPQMGGITVECRYVNAVAAEWPQKWFQSQAFADRFYCPRWKKVGEAI